MSMTALDLFYLLFFVAIVLSWFGRWPVKCVSMPIALVCVFAVLTLERMP